MKISNTGIELIKKFEGCKLSAYQDSVGVWTIGYGTTNADKSITGTTIQSGLTISQATADEWLETSVNSKYSPLVDKYDSTYHWNQNQFDALVSFAYNIGSIDGVTAKGTRTISEISAKILEYNKAGGKVLNGLVTRRKAEKELFDKAVEETNMVRVGSARINENGTTTGGNAGDQTGNEVGVQNWYLHSKGWIVIRPKDAAIAEKIATNMNNACVNDNIGYCQTHRTGALTLSKAFNYDLSKITEATEVDCSELVRICILFAGIYVSDFTTADEVSVLQATGQFEILTDDKYCTSSDYLKRGDILVTKTKGHTVVVLDNGTKAETSVVGWNKDQYGWWYKRTDGTYPVNCWELIDHYWYLFNSDGYMLTGWQQWDSANKQIGSGDWYYLDTTNGSTMGQCWHEKDNYIGAMEPWYVE
jgi:GH24 family phage-related lysozyme (muramidase)